MSVVVESLGLIEYSKALQAQEEALSEVLKNRSREKILVCEHPTVITIGRAQGAREEVFSQDIPVFEVSRGGRSTLHLPGQVVVYPILDLEKRGKDLHAYMRLLERAIVSTLNDFRIEARAIEGKTGVWVDSIKGGEKKIASLGIAVKEWVSYHGIALNACCDLTVFSKLSPCGFSSDVMTSMIEEMSQKYKEVWKITPETLLKRVRTRIVEDLVEELAERE